MYSKEELIAAKKVLSNLGSYNTPADILLEAINVMLTGIEYITVEGCVAESDIINFDDYKTLLMGAI